LYSFAMVFRPFWGSPAKTSNLSRKYGMAQGLNQLPPHQNLACVAG
jgi:hypothetical protein